MKSDSRTGYTIKNVISSLADKGLCTLLKFITRVIFVKKLGETMLGISGLFSNVLGMLALAELGLGTAINFSLYEPCAKNDEAKIGALMKFFRNAYRIISLIVSILGLMIMPLLPKLIKGDAADNIPYFYLIYLLFLFNMAVEYFFSYKRSLAVAYQKNYLLIPFIMGSEILLCIFQIFVLFAFAESDYCYLLYLASQSIVILLQNLIINRYLDKKYPILLKLDSLPPLGKEERNSIAVNVKALIYHKIGGWAVTGTDNILISSMIDLITVGYYSNYSSLILTVSGIVYLFVGNVTSSFGNLIVEEAPEKRLKVFEELNFFYSFIYAVCAAMFISLFTPFISLVYGERFLLGMDVVVLVVFANFYLLGMTYVLDVVKSAAGIYDKDKWVPLVQAATNLIISIVLGKMIGLVGIFIGTLVSTLVPLIAKPYIIYKYVFETKCSSYFAELIKQILIAALISVSSYSLCAMIPISNLILKLIINLFITGTVGISVFFAFNFKSPYFKSLIGRIKSIFQRSI